MRNMAKTARHWLAVGWFWPLVLLVLPDCGFQAGSTTSTPPPNLNPGTGSPTSVVFCDIEPPIFGRHCASPEEVAQGVRIADGAVALNNGSVSAIAIDDSPAALAACSGTPQAVQFYGAFPNGYASCVTAGDIGPGGNYSNTDALCAAQCEDFFGETDSSGTLTPDNPPDPSVAAWCQANAHAHASTNFPETPLTSSLDFTSGCTTGGAFNTTFADPRRAREAVVWRDGVNVAASGNTLTKNAGMTTAFDAGADSSQTIAVGSDGFVDFVSGENTKAKFLGLSTGSPPEPNVDFHHIGFAIELSNDETISIWESGTEVKHQIAPYNAGDHFRVHVQASSDGTTATVTYTQIPAANACVDGQACNEQLLYTSTAHPPYPFRVDASLEDLNGTLTAQLVRIHQ